jgi:glycosyltransferase involved in cell wall biosynthesis
MPHTTLAQAQSSGREGYTAGSGALDGLTIMRYAHMHRDRSSGGVEQYLRRLDHGLLRRHRLTILQMHLMRDDRNDAVEVENIGIGRIVWVPVPFRQTNPSLADLASRMDYVYSRSLRMHQQQGKGLLPSIFASLRNLLRHHGGHLRYKATVLSERLAQMLLKQRVDLLALHWLSYDTGNVISHALRSRTPFVLINHFENSRLTLPTARKWTSRAAAVAGISCQGIPDHLRDRYVNLSDAVDTDFFDPEKARVEPLSGPPIVLLPARIEAGKGHHDLVEAARILIAKKTQLVVCFAGAVDSDSLHRELRKTVTEKGLERQVLFLGEKSAKDLRDWYARSSVVVLPSCSEGLGRILLEAQAMKKPVVAYDSGGIKEAILLNHTGFLVGTGDVEALADKIGMLLENEKNRLCIGESGREFVSRQFSVSALIQRHEAFYLGALSSARRNGAFIGRQVHES